MVWEGILRFLRRRPSMLFALLVILLMCWFHCKSDVIVTPGSYVVQVGFWYMAPMWAAPDLSHVGFWYMGPICGQPLIYPKWAPCMWDPCGQPNIYPMLAFGIYGAHVGSPRCIPCGLLVYGSHVGSPILNPFRLLVYGKHVGSPRLIPCGLLVHGAHICGLPRWLRSGYLGCIYGARLAQPKWDPVVICTVAPIWGPCW